MDYILRGTSGEATPVLVNYLLSQSSQERFQSYSLNCNAVEGRKTVFMNANICEDRSMLVFRHVCVNVMLASAPAAFLL